MTPLNIIKQHGGEMLRKAKTHHLLVEVLKDFENCIYGKAWRKGMEGTEEHYIILNALVYAMRSWDFKI